MVAMKKNSYIPPSVKELPVQFDELFCLSDVTTNPYEDNGDYDWN